VTSGFPGFIVGCARAGSVPAVTTTPTNSAAAIAGVREMKRYKSRYYPATSLPTFKCAAVMRAGAVGLLCSDVKAGTFATGYLRDTQVTISECTCAVY